uniref:Uncharacterized protein n=1 Tax=Arundo donax TaxID=35708 RepID=A0A0A8YI62_ARUDO
MRTMSSPWRSKQRRLHYDSSGSYHRAELHRRWHGRGIMWPRKLATEQPWGQAAQEGGVGAAAGAGGTGGRRRHGCGNKRHRRATTSRCKP